MKTKKLTYWLFYSAALLVFLVSVFAYDLIIYVKPLVILSLTLLYILNAKKVNHLVVLSLPLILVCEIIFLKGYLENFVILHILLSAYYALNIAVLWKSLRRIKIKFRKVFTLQLAISMILITYVLFSVAQLILPQVSDHILVLIMLIIFFALFIGVCYYIYLNSKTVVSYSLMVAASCFLIVNIVNALNKLYVSVEVFRIITTLLQIFGQFFLIKFFIEQHRLVPNEDDYFG